ncbi:MAG: hypothetical protein WDN28_20585 [Chthoniobacter sp.]
MLSPGMWIAMRAGECLADLISPRGPNDWPGLLATYESEIRQRLTSWQELIAKFYNGEMMAAYATGIRYGTKFPRSLFRALNTHVDRNFAACAAVLIQSAPTAGSCSISSVTIPAASIRRIL